MLSPSPINQMCLFASMDNAPPETCNIKSIKLNSFLGCSIPFSSVIQICDSECDQITSATKSSKMVSVSKVLIISNVLKYYFKFLLMSMLCTDNFMTGFLYHNFQFFSDIVKAWLHYDQKKTCAARTSKGSLCNNINMFSEIIVLVKLLLLAPAANAISECSCSTLKRITT